MHHAAAAYDPPDDEAYSLDDPNADHREHGIEMDEAGHPDKAIASFRAAVRFEPAESSHWNNLGVALLEGAEEGSDEESEALESFERALKANPANQEALEAHQRLLARRPPMVSKEEEEEGSEL